jgi:hypothetical protein
MTTVEEKRELWLKDKTPEYVHGWRECEKGNPHKQFMYPDQHDQDEYSVGYSEFFAIQECSAPVQQESDYV